MKTRPILPFWRKIYFVNPRLQGSAALLFAIVVGVAGLIFGVSVFLYLKSALRVASLRGHFAMGTPYEVVRQGLVWHILGLFAGVSLLGTGAFLFLIRATGQGLGHVIAALHASADADLSTPTHAPGLPEFKRFGAQVDDIRMMTLEQIREIRGEAAALAGGSAPRDEFRLRWDMLKQKIRRLAP
jgi:hypothetical protein